MRGRRDRQRPCAGSRGPTVGPTGPGAPSSQSRIPGSAGCQPQALGPRSDRPPGSAPTPAAPLPTQPRRWPHPQATLTCKVSPTLQLWKHNSPVHFKAKFKHHLPCLVLLFSPVDSPLSPPTDATAQGPGDAQWPHQRGSHPRSMVACYSS